MAYLVLEVTDQYYVPSAMGHPHILNPLTKCFLHISSLYPLWYLFKGQDSQPFFNSKFNQSQPSPTLSFLHCLMWKLRSAVTVKSGIHYALQIFHLFIQFLSKDCMPQYWYINCRVMVTSFFVAKQPSTSIIIINNEVFFYWRIFNF